MARTVTPSTRRIPVALVCLIGLVGVGCSADTTRSRSTDLLTVTSTGSVPSSCVGALVRSRSLRPLPAPPRAASTALRASILSEFAIFRRGALRRDAPPIRTDILSAELAKENELSTYYPGYLRQLGSFDGRRYYVIPVFGRPEALPPANCRPAAVRRELVKQRHQLLTEVFYCVIETDGGRLRSPGCEAFGTIGEARAVFSSGVVPVASGPAVGLVPDGVASLRIAYRESTPIVVPVRENAFLFAPHPPSGRVQAKVRRLEREEKRRLTRAAQRRWELRWSSAITATEPARVEWLNSMGEVLRTIRSPASPVSFGIVRTPIGG
jgi:hypothetical protein